MAERPSVGTDAKGEHLSRDGVRAERVLAYGRKAERSPSAVHRGVRRRVHRWRLTYRGSRITCPGVIRFGSAIPLVAASPR